MMIIMIITIIISSRRARARARFLPVSREKTLLRRGGREEILAFETRNQGLERSFRRRIAGQRLTQKE